MLLAIWHDVGGRMRALLEAYTLDDLAGITEGKLPWPGDAG